MHRPTITLALACLTAACGDSPPPTGPHVTDVDVVTAFTTWPPSEQQLPFSQTVQTCAEPIDMEGYQSPSGHINESANGDLHVFSHFRLRARGVGRVTGSKYLWIESLTFHTNNPFGGGARIDILNKFHTRILGLGGAPDLRARGVVRTTVTPEGEVVVEFDRLDVRCD